MIAPGALRANQVCAFLMVGVVDASTLDATRAHKEAPCTVRPMVVVSAAYLRGARKELREVRLCAKDTVEGGGVFLKGVGCARRVSMVGRTTV